MSRDHRTLKVFAEADELIITVYAETAIFPREVYRGFAPKYNRLLAGLQKLLDSRQGQP
jgi:hypothetical protein